MTSLKVVALILLLWLPLLSVATTKSVALEHVDASLSDVVSLQKGAELFSYYCVACHSAQYLRYEQLQKDVQIADSVLQQQVTLGRTERNHGIKANLSKEDAKKGFGLIPPDLSYIAKTKDPNWLYTYLRSFYRDPKSQTGWNNLVSPNTMMMNTLSGLQGVQVPLYDIVVTNNGEKKQVFTKFNLIHAGEMSPQEFNQAIRDLTRFLVYMGEPSKLVRYNYGLWVMAFLLIFAVLAYLLKKEFWRDVHQ